MTLNFKFSARGPDRVSEELATVLSKKGAWMFKDIFDMVHDGLRAKDLARGGEEMLRLRAHEKLQAFLLAGIVTKSGKEYRGVPKALAAFFKTASEFNARFAAGTHCHPAGKSRHFKDNPTKGDTGETKLSVRKAAQGLGKKSEAG